MPNKIASKPMTTSPSETVVFGIIGAGSVSSLHAAAIRNCPEAHLAAVADVCEERARKLADGAEVYTDYRRLLERRDIDAVCVCVPSGMHMPVCIDAANAGKHVLVEKPLEVTLEKADAIINACDKASVKLGVIFQVRFLPGVQAAKEAVSTGQLGKLVMGDAYVKWHRSQDYYDSSDWRGTWEMDGGGALMNQAIHHVDLLQWMMGPVDSIFGYTDTLVRERIEVEDTAAACLRFVNGAVGTIEACTSAKNGVPARLEIRGELGTIVLEDGKIALWDIEGVPLPELDLVDLGSGASDPKAITSVGHQAQIQDLARAIKENRQPVVDGREARKAVEIVTAIYRSARTGAPVKLPL
ncbi:MAG: Gfo/Idh/MocA family oxidoreductase [Armatimonadota bacterium]|nr:Gfo/Idh/MocA family oxidoreductase [Armatimonadota bacterium]